MSVALISLYAKQREQCITQHCLPSSINLHLKHCFLTQGVTVTSLWSVTQASEITILFSFKYMLNIECIN